MVDRTADSLHTQPGEERHSQPWPSASSRQSSVQSAHTQLADEGLDRPRSQHAQRASEEHSRPNPQHAQQLFGGRLADRATAQSGNTAQSGTAASRQASSSMQPAAAPQEKKSVVPAKPYATEQSLKVGRACILHD